MSDLLNYFSKADIDVILFQEGYNQFRVDLRVEYVPSHGKSDFTTRSLVVAFKGSYEEFISLVPLDRDYLLSEFNTLSYNYGDFSVASRIVTSRFIELIKNPKLTNRFIEQIKTPKLVGGN